MEYINIIIFKLTKNFSNYLKYIKLHRSLDHIRNDVT